MTKVDGGAGKHPSWKDVFVYQGERVNSFDFNVYDQDTISDDLIGNGTIDLAPLYASKTINGW